MFPKLWSLAIFKHDDIHPRNLLPALFLIAYSFGGATIFIFLEKHGSCNYDYWSSLFFAFTVYSTIGYGNVFPCTAGGKVFTVIYALFGIPVALVVLDNLGKMFAAFANFIWIRYRFMCSRRTILVQKLKYRRNAIGRLMAANKSKGTASADAEQAAVLTNELDKEILPIWIGIPIALFWILISAYCFARLEDNLHFGDAVYFMLISAMTIGFGDIVPAKLQYTIFYQFLLIIALALFSMSINIVQLNVEMVTQKTIAAIADQYKEKLQYDETTNNDSGSGSHSKFDEIINKQPGGWFLKYLLGKTVRENLLKEIEYRIGMKNKSCQVKVETEDKCTSIRDHILYKSKMTQTRLTVDKWKWKKL